MPIGLPESLPGPAPLAVSPDGHKVAFVLSRVDSERIGYRGALVAMPFEHGSRPLITDHGGDLITPKTFVRRLDGNTGLPSAVTS